MRMPSRRAASAVAVLLILAASGWLITSRRNQESSGATGAGRKLPVVVVSPATREIMTRSIDLTGSVEPVRTALLASPAEGPVQNLRVLEGDSVRAGDLLLTIGRTEAADASLAYAREAERREAEELRRIEELVRMGALPSEELDQAQVNYQRARAQLQQAQELFGDHRVVAPWDAVVARVHVHDGNYVGPRAPLVELFDPRTLVVRFAVPEAAAAVVRDGMPARVVLDAYPDKTFRARVSRVYPELDRQLRTRTVEAELSEGAVLAPGMFARVSVELERASDATVIPDQGIQVTPEGDMVVFVVKDGVASRCRVTVGIEQGHRIQVLSGIEVGDLVVVSGQSKVRDGMAVQIRQRSSQEGSP